MNSSDSVASGDPVADDGAGASVGHEDFRREVVRLQGFAQADGLSVGDDLVADPGHVAEFFRGFEGNALGGLSVAEVDSEFLLNLVPECFFEELGGGDAIFYAVSDVVESNGGVSVVISPK